MLLRDIRIKGLETWLKKGPSLDSAPLLLSAHQLWLPGYSCVSWRTWASLSGSLYQCILSLGNSNFVSCCLKIKVLDICKMLWCVSAIPLFPLSPRGDPFLTHWITVAPLVQLPQRSVRDWRLRHRGRSLLFQLSHWLFGFASSRACEAIPASVSVLLSRILRMTELPSCHYVCSSLLSASLSPTADLPLSTNSHAVYQEILWFCS